jgi:hypothetical protein
MRRPLLLIAVVTLAAGCKSNVGTINITIVTAPSDEGTTQADPFEDAREIRITVTGPGGLKLVSPEIPIAEQRGSLDKIPVGPDRQVTVEGIGPEGDVVYRGRTGPFEIEDGTVAITLFVGRVDSFSHVTDKKLGAARAFHTATLLRDGRVLLCGGVEGGQSWHPLQAGPFPGATRTAELVDGNSLRARATVSMAAARLGHTATVTERDNVLVVGGAASPGFPDAGPPDQGPSPDLVPVVDAALPDAAPSDAQSVDLAPLDAAAADKTGSKDTAPVQLELNELLELFDPVANKFARSSATLLTPRLWHGAAATSSGVVLIGGANQSFSALQSVELYVGGKRISAPGLKQRRWGFATTVLEDGSVLVSGGVDKNYALGSMERFDPDTLKWSVVQASIAPRAFHTATLLDDGSVLLYGGISSLSTTTPDFTPYVERYDPATGKVSRVEAPQRALRWAHSATLLASGDVLVAGGFLKVTDKSSALTTFADLVTVAGTVVDIRPTHSMREPRAGHAATRLRSGMVLISGGITHGNRPTDTAEVYIY